MNSPTICFFLCLGFMDKLFYKIDNQGKMEDLVITRPATEDERYRIELEGKVLGYLFFSQMNDDLGCPIWEATTPSLSLIASELGEFIERSDL
jgi:hypothetical protein